MEHKCENCEKNSCELDCVFCWHNNIHTSNKLSCHFTPKQNEPEEEVKTRKVVEDCTACGRNTYCLGCCEHYGVITESAILSENKQLAAEVERLKEENARLVVESKEYFPWHNAWKNELDHANELSRIGDKLIKEIEQLQNRITELEAEKDEYKTSWKAAFKELSKIAELSK